MMKKTNKTKRPVEVLNKNMFANKDMFADFALANLCIAESFSISEKERKDIAVWAIKHLGKCQGPHNALTYSFRHTGIGVIIKAKCPTCGEEFDASDFESW